MITERVAGWPRLLNEYLLEAQARYRDQGFEWGRFDCCTFCADWVERLTGDDVMTEYRGRYTDHDSGFELVYGDLAKALEAIFGEGIHPAKAHRGDVLFSAAIDSCGIAIVQGTRMNAIFLGEGGFTLLHARHCDFAFPVGRSP